MVTSVYQDGACMKDMGLVQQWRGAVIATDDFLTALLTRIILTTFKFLNGRPSLHHANTAANACRPSRDGAPQLNGGLSASSSAAPQKAWDIEQGPLDLMMPSADPLLKLGRLPSISETGNSKQPLFIFVFPWQLCTCARSSE